MTRERNTRRRLRTAIFLVISTLIIFIGGGTTLLWQQNHNGKADGGNIVSPPTLPAKTVDAILKSMGSPMAGTGSVIEQAARQTNIDDAFALAVWWTETNDGAAGVGSADRNPGSVRGSPNYPTAFDGYTIYPSYSVGIKDWFTIVKSRYINRGLTSIYTLCHPYVGTATACSAGGWAGKVFNLMVRYHGQAPLPSLSPTPVPTLAPALTHIALQPIPTAAPRKTQVTQTAPSVVSLAPSQSQHRFLPVGQSLLAGFGLLIALVLAFWGAMIRRSIPTLSNASLAQSEPALSSKPPFANAFSSFAAQQPFIPATPVTEQLPFPAAIPASAGGGLLTRYSPSKAGPPRRVALLPSNAQPDQLPAHPEQEREGWTPTTETLQPFTHAAWADSALSPVSVRSAPDSLLRHYKHGHDPENFSNSMENRARNS